MGGLARDLVMHERQKKFHFRLFLIYWTSFKLPPILPHPPAYNKAIVSVDEILVKVLSVDSANRMFEKILLLRLEGGSGDPN